MQAYISSALFQIDDSPRMAEEEGLLGSERVTLAKHYVLERKRENVLGTGGYGTIWKGVDATLNEPVAVKQVRMNYRTHRLLDRELKFLQSCNHRHILHLLGYDTDDSFAYLILELCNGNLDQIVKDMDIDLHTCLTYMRDLSDGIQYLHSKRIVHRDLKPENVLVKDDIIKLADFGLSKELCASFTPDCATRVGTPGWMPPEFCIVKGTSEDDLSVDVFALALLVLSLLNHQPGKHLEPHTGMQFLFILSFHTDFRNMK